MPHTTDRSTIHKELLANLRALEAIKGTSNIARHRRRKLRALIAQQKALLV